MRLTAEFDSVNSADLAAAAIRKSISPFSDISVRENRTQKEYTSDKSMRVFNSFNPSVNQYIYSMPVSTGGIYSNTINSLTESDNRSGAVLSVTCRTEDEKKASSVIINHGGHDIFVSQ